MRGPLRKIGTGDVCMSCPSNIENESVVLKESQLLMEQDLNRLQKIEKEFCAVEVKRAQAQDIHKKLTTAGLVLGVLSMAVLCVLFLTLMFI